MVADEERDEAVVVVVLLVVVVVLADGVEVDAVELVVVVAGVAVNVDEAEDVDDDENNDVIIGAVTGDSVSAVVELPCAVNPILAMLVRVLDGCAVEQETVNGKRTLHSFSYSVCNSTI